MANAVHLMSENRVRRLPIVSDSTKAPIGMLSNKDILKLLNRIVSADESANFRMKISEIMTRDVISVEAEDDIRVAASRMMIFGIGGLAVQEDSGPILGLITERDLIKRLSQVRSVGFLVPSMNFELEILKHN